MDDQEDGEESVERRLLRRLREDGDLIDELTLVAEVDGEIIGDPLDVKMFEFTKWTLEEGHVAGTGVVKNKSGGDRPAALVQTVVRPPGSAQFRIEDALKGAGRVSDPCLAFGGNG